jgi:hypothetical protein
MLSDIQLRKGYCQPLTQLPGPKDIAFVLLPAVCRNMAGVSRTIVSSLVLINPQFFLPLAIYLVKFCAKFHLTRTKTFPLTDF